MLFQKNEFLQRTTEGDDVFLLPPVPSLYFRRRFSADTFRKPVDISCHGDGKHCLRKAGAETGLGKILHRKSSPGTAPGTARSQAQNL